MEAVITAVRAAAEKYAFSGVVSIFQAGKEVYGEAFGYADIANGRKNNLKTKFGIASGTKTFTAVGIGALVDQGRLALDRTIWDIFGQELSWIDQRATVHDVLTHTSGMFDYYDEELITDFENFYVDLPWYRLATPMDYLPLFEGRPPKFAPGERFSYSNGGYICLGMVIEKLTGRLYRDFIQEYVLNPAGMQDSGFYAFNRLPENTANGYKVGGDGEFETNIYNLPIRGASDGGLYTTTDDLCSFWQAFFNRRLLSDALTTRFITPQARISSRTEYGYGFYLSKLNGMDVLFFVGGDAGVGFDSRCIPAKDLFVNILSNKTEGEGELREVIRMELEKTL